jgi:hypothetical protein
VEAISTAVGKTCANSCAASLAEFCEVTNMRMLDLFCGRMGWSKAFLARGWECVGVDLVEPPEIPAGFEFLRTDVLRLQFREHFNDAMEFCWESSGEREWLGEFDFICASSPCEQFSVHGMKHFHPNPPYPELGIKLFNHTRAICEASGVPYVMENVRAAEEFVGKAAMRCGPFSLWGTGVPPILPQGIKKGVSIGNGKAVRGMSPEQRKAYRKQFAALQMGSKSAERQNETASWATIPPELSSCVADYAERLLEVRV